MATHDDDDGGRPPRDACTVAPYRAGAPAAPRTPHAYEERDRAITEVLVRWGPAIVHTAHLDAHQGFALSAEDVAAALEPSPGRAAFVFWARSLGWGLAVLAVCGAGTGMRLATAQLLLFAAVGVVLAVRWTVARRDHRAARDPARLFVAAELLEGARTAPLIIADAHGGGPTVRLRASHGDELVADGVPRGADAWLASGEGRAAPDAPGVVLVPLAAGRLARLRFGALRVTARVVPAARALPAARGRDGRMALALGFAAVACFGALGAARFATPTHAALSADRRDAPQEPDDPPRPRRVWLPFDTAPLADALPRHPGDPRALTVSEGSAQWPAGGFDAEFNWGSADDWSGPTGRRWGCDPDRAWDAPLDHWDRPLAPAAGVSVAAVRARGALSTRAVALALEQAQSRIARCYRRTLADVSARPAARVRLALHVTPRGTVDDLSEPRPYAPSPELGACAACVLGQVRFPAAHRGTRVMVRVAAARW